METTQRILIWLCLKLRMRWRSNREKKMWRSVFRIYLSLLFLLRLHKKRNLVSILSSILG